MNSNESAENYLETILILSQSRPVVRSVDIAEELGYKKSSVSVAMKNHRLKEHIHPPDGIRQSHCGHDLRAAPAAHGLAGAAWCRPGNRSRRCMPDGTCHQ